MSRATNAMDIYKELIKPFPIKSLQWRKGAGGRFFVYIDARDVMQRLDDVCGWEGWQTTYKTEGGITICTLAILNPDNDRWIGKSDGSGETGMESEKGAISGAFKRAAAAHGIGRYLYWMKYYPQLSAKQEVPEWMNPEHERWK